MPAPWPTPCAATPPIGVQAHTATQMSIALAQGATTPTRLVEEHLSVIDALEAKLSAWAYVGRDGARQRARSLDERTASTALHGIPFGVKDNIDTCDMPTAYGSVIHERNVPARDATCVACLRLAGANPLGKAASAEFAHREPGATRNPWNPEHTPGGSSSGSAAAVASGMVPFALGSQTTGSVIRPAAYCGVIGYKPTYGEFNIAGTLANTPAFDTLGVIARCVPDVVLVRRALLDASIPDRVPVSFEAARVGLCRTPYWSRADAPTKELLDRVTTTLQRAGVIIAEFDDDAIFDGLEHANVIVSGYEFARTMAHERRTAYQQLSTILREGRMADGLEASYAEYASASEHLSSARGALDAALAAFDFIITPAAPGAAPQGLNSTGTAEFNMAWTTLHAPAITLPVAMSPQALPLGIQLVSRRHSDDRLLAFADGVFHLLTT